MTTSISSSSLGLQNPLRPLGWARLVAAACVLGLVVASSGIALSQRVEDPVRIVVFARCGLALLFVVNLVASGLRALLAFVPQGDVPGPLRQGASGGRGLLEKKLITGTYDQPTSLMGLLIYQLMPRFSLLTPPHRQAMQGVGIRLFWLTVSLGAAYFVDWPALWVALIVVIELAARWTAIIVANPEHPATTGVQELREHLGDKGDPVGLFHHLRQVCEKYRFDDFPNFCLAESAPHVAEQVRDARIAAEYFVETQPHPISASGQDGIVLGTAAVLLAILGWGLLLLTPLTGSFTPGTLIAMGSGLFGVAASATCFRLAFLCHAGMRFQSDLFLMRMRGTYNTTRVGSQLQRTSFQSDVYLDIFSARIVSELVPSDGHLSVGWRIDEVLRSSRLIVTVLDEELLSSRMADLIQSARTYQDQASSARPTDLSSPEYAQHLLRLQAESFIAAQAGMQGHLVAQSTTQAALPNNTPTLPHTLPAALLSVPASTNLAKRPVTPATVVGSAKTGQTAGGLPLPVAPPVNSSIRSTANPPPKKIVLPPPPPKRPP